MRGRRTGGFWVETNALLGTIPTKRKSQRLFAEGIVADRHWPADYSSGGRILLWVGNSSSLEFCWQELFEFYSFYSSPKKTERQQISVVAQLQLSAGKLFSPWGLRQDKRIEFHRRTVVSNNRALLSFCCPWFTEWRLKAALRWQNGG